jgi:glycosyltransferase involved in cell wall biosynthesis
MNQRPLVSVIIPAFNAEVVLADTLASARQQTYSNIEVIVVDDGSTDGTVEVARRFAEMDKRFRWFQQANAGSAVARNKAIKQSSGELIAFLDADDIWLPGKVHAQLELLRSDPRANLIFSNCWIWDGKRDYGLRHSTRRKFPEGDVTAKLIGWDLFATSSVVIRRDLLDRVGIFDPELKNAQDWDLWLRIAETGLWARGVWEPQMRYRIWPGNVSANKVRANTYFVRLFEKAVARPQPPVRLRQYQRALQQARAHLELAKAQACIDESPDAVAPTVLNAWRQYPIQLKWLFRYVGLVWPAALGGRWTSEAVRRHLKKWRQGIRPEVASETAKSADSPANQDAKTELH